jgi:type VI secretion system secreted protein Hcp
VSIDAYLTFRKTDGTYLKTDATNLPRLQSTTGTAVQQSAMFPIFSYSLGTSSSVGLGPGGVGSGRIVFQNLSVMRLVDSATPVLYEMSCLGGSFESVELYVVDSSLAKPQAFAQWTMKVVVVSSMSWSGGGENPNESLSLEFGGLEIRFDKTVAGVVQGPPTLAGWNGLTNVPDTTPGTTPLPVS